MVEDKGDHMGNPMKDIRHGSKCRSPKCMKPWTMISRCLVQVVSLLDRPEELVEGHISFPLIAHNEDTDDKLLAEPNGGNID
jgi:hypothetical protein